jgi:hypothetical protein
VHSMYLPYWELILISFMFFVGGGLIILMVIAFSNIDIKIGDVIVGLCNIINEKKWYRKGYNAAMKEWKDTLELK